VSPLKLILLDFDDPDITLAYHFHESEKESCWTSYHQAEACITSLFVQASVRRETLDWRQQLTLSLNQRRKVFVVVISGWHVTMMEVSFELLEIL
jgi:hypothetical protein